MSSFILLFPGSPKQFSRFTISVDSQHAPNSPISRVGSFQLYSDSLTAFNEDCVNTISESTDQLKSEVQVMWRAPPPGSGCVIFTAMVLETPDIWFAEDGALVKTFCEARPEELENRDESTTCCACDDAKYSVSVKMKSNYKQLFSRKFLSMSNRKIS